MGLVTGMLIALGQLPGFAQTPQPRAGDPAFRHAGRVQLSDLIARDGAVVDDDTVVLVGSTMGADLFVRDTDLLPNGYVLDLGRKAAPKRFTNGHAAPLCSVAAGHGMIATVSSTLDPTVRVAEVKTRKAVAEIPFGEPDQNAARSFAVRWLHKSARLAVFADKHIQVLDPKAPRERVTYPPPPEALGHSFVNFAVAPDDTRIACTANLGQIDDHNAGVFLWQSAQTEPSAISIAPPKAADRRDWRAGGIAFGRGGVLVAWRHGAGAEVPPKTAEKDVPADRRSVVRIDPDRKVIPTGMGMSAAPWACAFDPSGEWLVVVGEGWLDPGREDPKDDITRWGELRVYHAATARLVHREQVLGQYTLTWAAFTPNGRRLVAATHGGTVHWWDVEQR